MKALMCHAFGPIDTLRVEERPSPVPAAGQVLIDVKAAAVNYPDALIVQGLYQIKPAFPFSPGAELAGVVTALGDGVQHLKVGDRVIAAVGHGAFAEECVADAAQVMPLLPGMDFELGAAFVLTYGTSLHALRRIGALEAGETLLVLGAAGGVGLAAIEIGKALGARVIAAASSAEKLALCRKVGADEAIDYSTEDLRKRVDALTGGKGAEVVYDPVGGAFAEAALRATAWRGRYLVIGFASGEIPKIPLNLALLMERAILGVFWGAAVRREPAALMDDMKQLGAWFAEGKVRPVISERVGLAGAAAAIQRLAGRQAMGKIVVLPEPGSVDI
jgi:NADPH:quinone reductase